MKKLSLLLIAFLGFLSTSAQEIFQTNFQTEEEFQQWLVVDANNDESSWRFDASASPSFVFYTYHSINAADDWMISPAITSAETGILALNFNVNGSSYGEKIEVFYGTEQSVEAMTNRLSDVIYLDDNTTSHLYLINANANEPLYFGFHACSDADTWRLYLCDVKVQFTSNPVDIQVTEFISPVSDFNLNQENVTVKVKNTGKMDIESFDISFSVNETIIATETVNKSIAIDEEIEYTFNAKADLSEARESYTLKAWTSHSDDINTSNDACYATVLHKAPATIPYSMGFEANEYTDGIVTFNLNDDEGNWNLHTDPWWNLAHTGDYCLAYNYDKNNNGNDWAILEPITIEETGYYVLKFWYSGSDDHPEKLRVCYGNEATPDAMTNQIAEYAPFANSSYQESISIINIEQAQTIFIGFYAFSDKDENWLCVDDVTFEKINAEDVDIAVLPITNPLQYVHDGTKKDISFSVRNLGIQDVSSTISVKIDEETVYEENTSILAQEIQDIVIEDILKEVTPGEHVINITVNTDDDKNEANNTQTLSFRIMDEPAAAWDFEDGQIPAEFSFSVEDEGTINPDAGSEFNEYGWGIFNIGEHELYGQHMLAGTSWLDGTDKADRWCILPPFTPTEESFLIWDVASFNPNFLETYSVMISTNGDNSWYYFTEETYLNESADLKTRGIDLSGYAYQDIYIAFRLRSENCENLILDNIELYGGTMAELLDVTTTIDPEEGYVEKLDNFTVTFENIESVTIESYSFYPPYIASVNDDNSLVQIASAKAVIVEEQENQIHISINEEGITEITEDGKYALVIPRNDLIFNNDSFLLTLQKEFIFYYTIGEEPKVPEAPVLTADVANDATIVTLNWNTIEDATSYNVYQDGEIIASDIEETSLEVTNLEAATTYCFTVTAVNEVGESAKSNEECVTTNDVGVEENEISINVYPNPVKDNIFIEADTDIEEISIYTTTGVMLCQQSTVNAQQSLSIDVTNFDSGVYIIKIRTENGESVRRILKF